ncbi:hypothetical protein [Caulobacter sp.]|uniref:hypothetical protein n=1 Tax=Caulobacter sp. TaxID=78 RepID=UPI003BAEBF00
MGSSIWTPTALRLSGVSVTAADRVANDATALFLEQTTPPLASRIGVLGPDAGEVLSSLWRRGFKRAQAARSAHPTADDTDARLDILFVAGSISADRATTSIVNAAGGLKCGGGLVVDLAAMPVEAEDALIERLAPMGFEPRPALQPHIQIVANKIADRHPPSRVAA